MGKNARFFLPTAESSIFGGEELARAFSPRGSRDFFPLLIRTLFFFFCVSPSLCLPGENTPPCPQNGRLFFSPSSSCRDPPSSVMRNASPACRSQRPVGHISVMEMTPTDPRASSYLPVGLLPVLWSGRDGLSPVTMSFLLYSIGTSFPPFSYGRGDPFHSFLQLGRANGDPFPPLRESLFLMSLQPVRVP